MLKYGRPILISKYHEARTLNVTNHRINTEIKIYIKYYFFKAI